MTCVNPIYAEWTNGKGSEVKFIDPRFDPISPATLLLPCRKCIGCRMDATRDWGVRCMAEAQSHSANSFITLTFNRENLPEDGCVDKRHIQLFMKRLRKAIAPIRVRYFACGEYGARGNRPHYHIILFGYAFPDRTQWTQSLYRSKLLESLWPYGYSSVGQVTFKSARYVAGYATKKLNAAPTPHLTPSFALMSRRPGIGHSGISVSMLNNGFVRCNDSKVSIPKYFLRKLSKSHPTEYAEYRLKQDDVHTRIAYETMCNLRLTNSSYGLYLKYRLSRIESYLSDKLNRVGLNHMAKTGPPL